MELSASGCSSPRITVTSIRRAGPPCRRGNCLLSLDQLARVAAECVQEAVEVFGAGEWIDDRHAQGADAVEIGRHDVELARLDQPAAELQLEAADPFGRSAAKRVGNVAENDDVALRLVERLEIGRGGKLLEQRLPKRKVTSTRSAKVEGEQGQTPRSKSARASCIDPVTQPLSYSSGRAPDRTDRGRPGETSRTGAPGLYKGRMRRGGDEEHLVGPDDASRGPARPAGGDAAG